MKDENLFETIKRVNEKEEREENEKKRKIEEAKQKEREEELNREKIELLKAKQKPQETFQNNKGHEEETQAYVPMSAKDKVINFLYYYKLVLIISTIVIAFFAVSLYSFFTEVRADGDLLFVTETMGVSTNYENIQNVLSKYCDDINNDGHQYYHVSYIPVDNEKTSHPEAYQANMTKLMVGLDGTAAMLIIANEDQDPDFKFADGLTDLRDMYPDNENVKQFGFYLKGTKFAELIGVDEVDEGLFIGIRKVQEGKSYTEDMRKSYNSSLKALQGFIEEMSK